MHDHPDKVLLLEAVARFLGEELRPALRDPALEFRTLIAANLVATIASEIQVEAEVDASELERLSALAGEVAHRIKPSQGPKNGSGHAIGPAADLGALNRWLAARLREADLQEPELERIAEHLVATLQQKLAIASPRFDLHQKIEEDAP